MRKNWILLCTFCLIFVSCNQKADKDLDWTHYVRTAGHGCRIDQIHNIMEDARNTCLFGIEVDNDLTGRYNSFINPDMKLEAIKAMADSAHAGNNYAYVYTAGLECITDGMTPQSRSFYRDHPDWAQRNKENKPAIFGSGAAFWIGENEEDVWISPYAPEWRQLYMQRIRQIAATGIDGVYIDIPYWMTHFDGWEDSWASFDTYTIQEKIEFEIITPRTLNKAKSDLIILPDVKCLSDKEYSQLELWLKNGKALISTGETGYYNDKREVSNNRTRIQDLSQKYPQAFHLEGTPPGAYPGIKRGME